MAWTLIDSKNAPTAGVFTFSPLTLTGYDVVQIVMSGITVTTDGTDIYLTFYVAGSEVTSGYRWGSLAASSGGSYTNVGDASDPQIVLGHITANWDTGNASTKSFGGIVTVDAPMSTALHKRTGGHVFAVGPTGNVVSHHCTGLMENAGAINGLKISGSSALTAGKVRILGL
jgi:hypothetical protein